MLQPSHLPPPSYACLLEKLYALSRGTGRLGLADMHALHQAIGSPANHLSTIHVAGTNGKGSVTTKIARTLTLSGYKVGRYTSPHISCFRERICINAEPMSEEKVRRYLSLLMEIADRAHLPYSFFELTTALAFFFFASERVDIAIIETGLGGRLDATNILNPELSIITSISHDHTLLLGSSLEEIAREKGGIIKKSTPVILGPKAGYPILEALAHSLDAPVYKVPPVTDGNYDQENSAIAATALHLLEKKWRIPKSALLEGIKIRPPCRMEEVPDSILAHSKIPTLPRHIILDVAHNPDGIASLLTAMRLRAKHRPIHILCGFSEDKEIEGMLQQLLDASTQLTLTAAAHPRAKPIQPLLELAKKIAPDKQIEAIQPIFDALCFAANKAKEADALLVICGTFFIMLEVRAALGFQESRDPFLLSEQLPSR